MIQGRAGPSRQRGGLELGGKPGVLGRLAWAARHLAVPRPGAQVVRRVERRERPARVVRLMPVAPMFGSEPGVACTLCDSDPARLIRERLLQADMLWNLAAVLLPLLLLLLIAALLVRSSQRP